MSRFLKDTLCPLLHSLSDEVRNEKVPNIDRAIDEYLAGPASKGNNYFQRIATGKLYRGNVVDMLTDIAPELVPKFEEAMVPRTDEEVLLQMVEFVERSKDGDGLDPVRIRTARDCIGLFSSTDANDAKKIRTTATNGKINGRNCEQVCVDYLLRRHRDKHHSVLKNVNVTPKSPHKHASSLLKTDTIRSNSVAGTGILRTNVDRNHSCSEFDALVVDTPSSGNSIRVVEMWEAKFTLSPNTLQDAIGKKLAAMQAILRDGDSSLILGGREFGLIDGVETAATLTFGIFGLEILPPPKALGQLLCRLALDMLSDNVGIVIKAMENGFVEVGKEMVCDRLSILQKTLNMLQDVNIVLKLSKTSLG